jgi:hypothetical protein
VGSGVSSNLHQSTWNKMSVCSPFQVLLCCIHYFCIHDDSANSIFQNAAICFIQGQWQRWDMGETVKAHENTGTLLQHFIWIDLVKKWARASFLPWL